jgi:hypothetical protein
MKAILVDPFNHKISYVQIYRRGDDSCLADILKHLNCDLIASVNLGGGESYVRNVMFVSDTGLYEPPKNTGYQAFFQTKWYPDPLAGYGIIVGTNYEGETIETTLSLKEVEESITSWSLPIFEA